MCQSLDRQSKVGGVKYQIIAIAKKAHTQTFFWRSYKQNSVQSSNTSFLTEEKSPKLCSKDNDTIFFITLFCLMQSKIYTYKWM